MDDKKLKSEKPKPTATAKSNSIIEKLVWGLVSMLIGIAIGEPLKAYGRYLWQSIHEPVEQMKKADELRTHLQEDDLREAEQIYLRVKDNPKFRADATSGLSRTKSSMATVNYVRGLSSDELAAQAIALALNALKESPRSIAAEIALAYAYAGSERSKRDMRATREKVKELRIKATNNADLDFLEWRSERTPTALYPDQVKIKDIRDLNILIPLAVEYLDRALTRSGQSRSSALAQAQSALDTADAVKAGNAIVAFYRGVLAMRIGQRAQEEQDFNRALQTDRSFPRARSDLAAVYIAEHRYDDARKELEDAVAEPSSQYDGRFIWLHNLGTVLVELGNVDGACKAFQTASEMPTSAREESNVTWTLPLGLAYCYSLRGQRDLAQAQFQEAVRLEGSLSRLETYTQGEAGPKELEIVGDLGVR